jgi:hypothetical protein
MVDVDLFGGRSWVKTVVPPFENGFMTADLQQVCEDAAKLADVPLWPLSDTDLTAMLQTVHQLQQTVGVLQARLVHQADTRGLPAAQGCRSIGGWLRALLRLDPQPARELVQHAAALAGHPTVEQAVLRGQADLRQAAVIAATLTAVPADLADNDTVGLADTGEIVRQAETVLVDMAARLPAHHLSRVGQRILDHVAPHLAEHADQAAQERQDARAQQHRGITLSLPSDGMVRLSGTLGVEDAAIVQAALHPLCAPVPDDQRSAAQRRADALTDVCRLALRTGQLPADGGEPPQLAVTVAYDPLTRMLNGAVTDTGQRLPATVVRRLACDARILPLVLGGSGQILDAGRTRRLATGPLRRALHVRDNGCRYPDCDRPPRWTDAHHLVSWTNGGPTDLDNLVLLCRHHHRLIHQPDAGWEIRLGPDRQPDFIPPPTIDPQRRPRRNLYHPPRPSNPTTTPPRRPDRSGHRDGPTQRPPRRPDRSGHRDGPTQRPPRRPDRSRHHDGPTHSPHRDSPPTAPTVTARL